MSPANIVHHDVCGVFVQNGRKLIQAKYVTSARLFRFFSLSSSFSTALEKSSSSFLFAFNVGDSPSPCNSMWSSGLDETSFSFSKLENVSFSISISRSYITQQQQQQGNTEVHTHYRFGLSEEKDKGRQEGKKKKNGVKVEGKIR